MPPPDPSITPEFLLAAYRRGYFPMARSRDDTGPLEWFNPARRAIIPLEGFHLPRRLRDRLRSGRFTITTDRAFEDVVEGCARARPAEPDSWINGEIRDLYTQLHRRQRAHSIEVWRSEGIGGAGELVGGLYGVHLGAVFCAESKFSRPERGGTDASKVALAHLLLHLRRRGFALLDVQVYSDHLAQFGCRELRRAEYLRALDGAAPRETAWEPFDPAANLELLGSL